jgi:hypothetical protein
VLDKLFSPTGQWTTLVVGLMLLIVAVIQTRGTKPPSKKTKTPSMEDLLDDMDRATAKKEALQALQSPPATGEVKDNDSFLAEQTYMWRKGRLDRPSKISGSIKATLRIPATADHILDCFNIGKTPAESKKVVEDFIGNTITVPGELRGGPSPDNFADGFHVAIGVSPGRLVFGSFEKHWRDQLVGLASGQKIKIEGEIEIIGKGFIGLCGCELLPKPPSPPSAS